MSVYVKNRKATKRGVRTWYRCDECGTYGDMSTTTAEVADDIIARFDARHPCRPAEAVSRV